MPWTLWAAIAAGNAVLAVALLGARRGAVGVLLVAAAVVAALAAASLALAVRRRGAAPPGGAHR